MMRRPTDEPSDQICRQTSLFIDQAIEKWKNAHRATLGSPRDRAGAELVSIYEEFIVNGFKWRGLLPVIGGDTEFQKKVLFGSVVLTYDIASAGIALASIRAGLTIESGAVPLWTISEYDKLCEFSETLNQEIDNQIAIAEEKTSAGPQVTMH